MALFPTWFQAMFLGQPSAVPLAFSNDATGLTQKSGKLTAPLGWLEEGSAAPLIPRSKVVDIFLPKDEFLTRRLEVPKKSLKQLQKIAELDLIQKTPFRPEQVYSVQTVSGTDTVSALVDQWIIRRDRVALIREALLHQGLHVRQVKIAAQDASVLADFSSDIAPLGRIWRRLNLFLFAIVLIGLGSLWAQPTLVLRDGLQSQQQQLSALREHAVRIREEMETLRGSADERTAFLQRVVERPLLSTTLRDLTTALPDASYISDLTFRLDSITLRGATRGSAAELVLGLAEISDFINPRLDGPISQTDDGYEQFEFILDLPSGEP